MEGSSDVEKVNAEFALGDAIDNICQYLKIKDLVNVSLVCKSWHIAASREMTRRGLERILIPDIYNKVIEDSNFHIGNLLNTKPYVALLFIGPSSRERYNKNLEFEILLRYRHLFPHHLAAVGVDESMMDENTIVSCPGLLGSPCGILGLFIPLYRDLKIKIGSYDNNFMIEKIIEDLSPGDKHSKSTFVVLANSYSNIPSRLLKLIKVRFKQNMYTLWGGIFDDYLRVIDCNAKDCQIPTVSLFALNISGSNFDSWSTVIDCRLKKQDVDKKLLDFRDNLKLKRSTVGLACGPRYVEDLHGQSNKCMYCNSYELMTAVKKVFPNIEFIGIFNYGYHSHFGVDSISNDCDQELAYQMAISLMILTYD